MVLIAKKITNASSTESLPLLVPGFDPANPVTLAPSATLDLLSVVSAETLHAMKDQLSALSTDGKITVVESIDSSLLFGGFQEVARFSDIGVSTDVPVTVLFTPTTTGLYQINGYAVCTASATGTDTSGQILVGWTDESGFNQWYFAPTALDTATLIAAGTNTVHAVAGNPIRFYTNGTHGPWATLRLNIYFTVTQL
jgi:hypothetical protein